MKKIKTVLVVGGGSAGWMAAGYLAVNGFDVTLIESPDVGIIGVGESTVPAIGWLANEMGMKEDEWMPLAKATRKLGIRHEDWTQGGSHWYNWFLYDRTRHIDQHKYLVSDELPPQSSLEYGYHVDAHLFGETICKVAAMKHSCRHIRAHIEHVVGNPETGIQELIDKEGNKFSADFYVDATGFKKLLMKCVDAKYLPYTNHLNDRAIACPQPSLTYLNRYTTTKARDVGWIWEIPLTHRRGTGYVYSSDFISDDEALNEYCKAYPGTDINNVSWLKFKPEVCTETIKLNVAAVGLSGGFIEPLEATSLFLTYFMVVQTCKHIKDDRNPGALNRNLKKVFDDAAGYVLSHYALSGKQHNEYWKYFNNLDCKSDLLSRCKQMAGKSDKGKWQTDVHFLPYHYWNLLNAYGLIE
jgi:hypothetical protein